jgi:hypothetical protein
MKKYNLANGDKAIIEYKKYLNGSGTGYLGSLPCVGLPDADSGGTTTDEITCMVLQTGYYRTDQNDALNTSTPGIIYPVGGYDITQGVAEGQIQGMYGKITSSLQKIWIQMNPQQNPSTDLTTYLEATLPHYFRVITVKSKRAASIASSATAAAGVQNPTLGENLFIMGDGNEKGLLSNMGSLEPFDALINKQKWIVLGDQRFTLCANTVATNSSSGNTLVYTSNVQQHPSSKFIQRYLPKPNKRTKWSFPPSGGITTPVSEPVDFNYITHTIILCRVKGALSGYKSNHWSVQTTGTTSVLDV